MEVAGMHNNTDFSLIWNCPSVVDDAVDWWKIVPGDCKTTLPIKWTFSPKAPLDLHVTLNGGNDDKCSWQIRWMCRERIQRVKCESCRTQLSVSEYWRFCRLRAMILALTLSLPRRRDISGAKITSSDSSIRSSIDRKLCTGPCL